jgi:RNA polymerase sigma factor (sigma-70 family)
VNEPQSQAALVIWCADPALRKRAVEPLADISHAIEPSWTLACERLRQEPCSALLMVVAEPDPQTASRITTVRDLAAAVCVWVGSNAPTGVVVEWMQRGAAAVASCQSPSSLLRDSIAATIQQRDANRRRREKRLRLTHRFGQLTDEERTILTLVYRGLTNQQIAEHLDLSLRTIESRRSRVAQKLEAKTFVELVTIVNDGVREGLLQVQGT